MRITKLTIAHGFRKATPFVSGLDIVRAELNKGVSLDRAIKLGEQHKGLPFTSKELEDAKNLTVHDPIVYIKPRTEPMNATYKLN